MNGVVTCWMHCIAVWSGVQTLLGCRDPQAIACADQAG